MLTSLAASVFWFGGSLLSPIIASNTEVFGEALVIETFEGEPPHNLEGTHCVAHVERPSLPVDAPIIAAGNLIHCTLRNENGPSYLMNLSLGNTPVFAWGNRFDRHLPFAINDQIAKGLFVALKQAHGGGTYGPMLGRDFICDPNGVICLEMLSLARRAPDDSPAALVCSRETERERVRTTECVFHPEMH